MARQQQHAVSGEYQQVPAVMQPPLPPPPIPQQTTSVRPHSHGGRTNPLMRAVASVRAPGKTVRDTVTVANGAMAVGAIEHVTNLPWPGAAALGVVLTGAGAAVGHMREATALGFGTGAAAGGWLLWSAATTPWSFSSVLSLLGASVLGGIAYARTRKRLQKIRELDDRVAAVTAERIANGNTNEVKTGWQDIFDRAQCKGVRVDDIKRLTDGAEGFRLSGSFTDPRYRYENLSADLGVIEVVADQMTPYRIRNGSFNIYRAEDGSASKWEMTIPTADILGNIIPHPIDHSPRSIETPIEFATAADGRRVSVRHADTAHGLISGMTDFGKSNLLNCFLFEWSRCTDAATCLIAGPTKAARTMKPLLAPWLRGEVPNPPIDRIAPTWEEAMRVLWDAKCAIRRRSKGKGLDDVSGKWKVTPSTPRIIIPIEEAGELLQEQRRWTAPDKTKWTFSDLLVDVITRARSEAINMVALTQGGTMDLAGDRGSSWKKQMIFRVAFRAQTTTERDAVLATDTRHVELASLGKGEVFTETSAADTAPTMALCDYMDDTANENTMTLAALNHYQYAASVDDWTAEAMPYYADRWTRPDIQQFLCELMGVDYDPAHAAPEPQQVEHQAYDSEETSVPDDPDAEVDAILEKARKAMEDDLRDAEIRRLEESLNATSRSLGDLESETLRLLKVLRDAPNKEVPMSDLTTAAAVVLGVDASTEVDRKVNAALRDVMNMTDEDLKDARVKRRGTVEGRKVTMVDMSQVHAQIRKLSGE